MPTIMILFVLRVLLASSLYYNVLLIVRFYMERDRERKSSNHRQRLQFRSVKLVHNNKIRLITKVADIMVLTPSE